MNEENNGTRSFQTTEQDKPQNKFDLKKIVSISIFAVAIVIVLLFIAALIAQIACTASNGKTPETNKPGGNNIEFVNLPVSQSDVTNGILQLANKDHPAKLSEDEISHLEKLYSTASRKSGATEYYTIAGHDRGDRLTLETAEHFGELAKALYNELGCNEITVKYAYFEPKSNTDDCDFSHALGTTLDICLLINGDSYALSQKPEVMNWINTNCQRFGFINSDLSGEVHDAGATLRTTQLRYVGIPHANYIMNAGISFESYLELLKNTATLNNPLLITGSDNNSYEVYYAIVNTINHVVKVPENFEYTISGNNESGVIITVNLSKAK